MPEQVPIISGSYMSRSVIANAQRCVNLYADRNPEDAPFPFTFYPTPGLTTLWTPVVPAAARGLYLATNGDLYYVVGNTVYYVSPIWGTTALGTLSTTTTPVSMKDNGVTMIVVDGTTQAKLVDLATKAFSAYADPNFLGADRVDYLDGYFLFNQPNTRNFYTTLLNSTAIDATYIVAKSAAPDLLSRVVCVQREAWLMGTQTSEVWANAGAPSFPFQEIPGAFIQQGIVAPYSVATHNNSIFWVAQNRDGRGVIMGSQGYRAVPISTPAIEAELATYGSISDAIGFCYSLLGHVYYVVSFPTADKTWSFDLTHNPPMPHEWSWADANGLEHRHRASCAAHAYGRILVGDWQNGILYSLDPFVGTDFGGPIIRRRGFPHLIKGMGRLTEYKQFQAEMEVGNITPEDSVSLRISNNRGRSWSQPMVRGLGSTGDYLRVPQWRQLGLARDMVFELFWSTANASALNGGFVDYDQTDG